MRKMTLKTTLFSAALLASVLEVQAQNNPITFTRDMTFRETYGWANSMCTPKIGDFDNDGVNDLWLDGQRQSYSWQTRTVFAKGLGEWIRPSYRRLIRYGRRMKTVISYWTVKAIRL